MPAKPSGNSSRTCRYSRSSTVQKRLWASKFSRWLTSMNRHEGTLAQRITAVLKAESDRLDHLVLAADLNPAADLRYGNWCDFDLTDANLCGFNFTGADLTGARFDNARIAGAVFDRAIYDLPSLRKAADFDEFLKREISRPAARRPH